MTLFYDNMGIVREETGVKNSLYRTEISSSKLNDNSFFSVNVFFFPKYSFFWKTKCQRNGNTLYYQFIHGFTHAKVSIYVEHHYVFHR